MQSNKNQVLPIGTVLRGKVYPYTIEKVLGQGAFGITYLASTSMKGPLGEVTVQVALKEFFAKELDSRMSDGTVTARTEDGIAYKYARAFQRESENLSKMKHPGIVKVLEAFEAKGTYYYSMEYLSGGSLDDKVKGTGIPESEALPLIRKIGSALSYMHDRKMMHLDLKPKNIMLKGDGSPVIIDFGLSKQFDSSGEPESSSTIGMGTPGSAPIEQANQTSGSSFQPTLDIYALGATLYKMLTGVVPPTSSSILEDGLPEDALKAKGVSDGPISAIIKAMQPRRQDRPQSVSAFLALLANPSESEETTVIVPKPKPKPLPDPSPEPAPGPRPKLMIKSRRTLWLWVLIAFNVALALALYILLGDGLLFSMKSTTRRHSSDTTVIVPTLSPPSGIINGHEWVDLGLSVKWATCNVGASSPSDYGDYFAWGETETKSDFKWATYKYSADEIGQSFSKYVPSYAWKYWGGRGSPDDITELEMSDDAAHDKWGGTWRMPTDAEWTELRTNCTWTWTSLNGRNGYFVTSKNGNSVFLPAAGHRSDSDLSNVGSQGCYWSSSLFLDYSYYAWFVRFFSSDVGRSNFYRYCGLSVRPVAE